MAAGDAAYNNSRSPKSPTARRTGSDSQNSPLSPRYNQSINFEQPRSPRDLPDERQASGAASTHGDMSSEDLRAARKVTASPTKAQSYSQLRNVSSPLPQSKPLGNSSPPSPHSTASPPLIGSSIRPETRTTPRTSSIDSAISGLSLNHLTLQKPLQDALSSSASDISSLIQAAGSAEVVIQHLLKERQSSAAQNTQLWKLVDKQRSLVLGLNQDLERALKDKDKYRKKLKEHLEKVPPVPNAFTKAALPGPRAVSGSPVPSEASADLPIQRQSVERASPSGLRETGIVSGSRTESRNEDDDMSLSGMPTGLDGADDWVRSKGRTDGAKHSHKTTSSSDVGVLGPTRPAPSVMPIQTSGLGSSNQRDPPESPSQSSQKARPSMSPTNSFTAKRSQPFSNKPLNAPTLTLIESTPIGNDLERMTPPRKAPPAPLDLGQSKREETAQLQYGPDDHSGSEYDDNVDGDELPLFERGRKKTREDDDREREVLLKEKEARSRSKKEKGSKSRTASIKSNQKEATNATQPQPTPIPPSIKALSPEPGPAGASTYLAAPTSLASVLSPPATRDGPDNTTERIISAKPMSPGLPLSPRPNHRPKNLPTPRMPRDGQGPTIASPPLSPRPGYVGLPLSPRAPRQPIPFPPHTPMSLASPNPPNVTDESEEYLRELTSPANKSVTSPRTQTDPQNAEISGSKVIYRGFVSEAYPNLLLPPNALPSILVRVVSSRLKPSRHSLVLRGCDEESVFTLGVSARSDRQGLWQVEKPITSLQQLDYQLRQSSVLNVKLPDRSLFTGHAPAKIDARRVALETYFETLLDTPMDEKAALKICHYLSTHASEPSSEETNNSATQHSGSPVTQGSDGRLVKEGYLTKRGKNFGGWKARFFVLNEPVLRYYETPGGSLLGTIKLQNAQIGKQTQSKSSPSPARTSEDGDGQYRHAFLIREPKRKDSSSFMDHVLCAENDAERDAWVAALLCYVEIPGFDGTVRPPLFNNDSDSSKIMVPSKKNSLKHDAATVDSPSSETFDSLQSVPYENTKQAEAPHVWITPDPRPSESPSPSTPTSGSQPSIGGQSAHSTQAKTISGPSNGAKISDAGAWGNKPMAPPVANQKEHKKRGIWGFRDKNPSDAGVNLPNGSNLSLPQQQYQEQITNVKAVFGAPLVEAVEYCAPHGVDICLPAVVYRCLEYLEANHAASEEGIFRMSGSNVVIKGLRSRFNAEGDIDLLSSDEQYTDVHAVASLLKLYLRELPQPVLTRELHLQFISILEISETQKKISAYNVLVNQLPKPNFTLIRALSAFLISIIDNSEINKMSMRNVGIVFSPTLNIPTPVLSMFLNEFEAIFRDAPENTSIPTLEITSSESLTPEDIRSPRRQMFSDIPTPSYTQNTFSNSARQPPQSNNAAYEQTSLDSQMSHDTGFIPLQPAYDAPSLQQGSMTVPGPEYAVARPRNLPSGGPAKARRRESSMLMMAPGPRKGPLPSTRNESGNPCAPGSTFAGN